MYGLQKAYDLTNLKEVDDLAAKLQELAILADFAGVTIGEMNVDDGSNKLKRDHASAAASAVSNLLVQLSDAVSESALPLYNVKA